MDKLKLGLNKAFCFHSLDFSLSLTLPKFNLIHKVAFLAGPSQDVFLLPHIPYVVRYNHTPIFRLPCHFRIQPGIITECQIGR